MSPFISSSGKQTEHASIGDECEVMAVFREMGNMVGSASQNLFGVWSQSWLRLSLSAWDFKGKNDSKQFRVFSSCCQEASYLLQPPVLSHHSQRPSHDIHYLTSTATSLTSNCDPTVRGDFLSLRGPACSQHAIIRTHLFWRGDGTWITQSARKWEMSARIVGHPRLVRDSRHLDGILVVAAGVHRSGKASYLFKGIGHPKMESLSFIDPLAILNLCKTQK